MSPEYKNLQLAEAPLLRMSRICKSFGSHQVLRHVQLELDAREVHVLVGENGAGKSTLIRILGGVHTADSGRIEIRGRTRRFRSPRHAAAHGVAIIHQDLSLVPALSVADNIFLGHEEATGGWLRRREQQHHAADVLRRLGVDIDVRRPVESFPIATRQLIEIAKALVLDAELIVMD
ncbi:MAG: ATP-binding cassette domain-containing protein, partial [Phycisphaerae bacterium]